MISIRLYQKKERIRADGKAPIYYVLAKGSQRKYIATKKYVQPGYFDNQKGLVKRGIDNSIKLNAYFKRKMTELDNIIIDLSNEGKEITFERIEQRFKNDFGKDFIAFALTELNSLKGLIASKTWIG